MSNSLLHFAEYELQIIALSWMAILYIIKIYQLTRLPMPWERAPKKGRPVAGVFRSYATIFMPWAMESSRQHLWRWLEFSLYHIGAGVAILNTFTLPFSPGLMTTPVRFVFSLLIAPSVILGVTKLIKRLSRREMRLISTPDDYFSLITLEVFFIAAIMALTVNTPLWRLVYFLVTAGFLFYVPFSKISHYIYFLFAGLISGSRYGWRGVLPQAGRIQ